MKQIHSHCSDTPCCKGLHGHATLPNDRWLPLLPFPGRHWFVFIDSKQRHHTRREASGKNFNDPLPEALPAGNVFSHQEILAPGSTFLVGMWPVNMHRPDQLWTRCLGETHPWSQEREARPPLAVQLMTRVPSSDFSWKGEGTSVSTRLRGPMETGSALTSSPASQERTSVRGGSGPFTMTLMPFDSQSPSLLLHRQPAAL